MIEAGAVIDMSGEVIHWHLPEGRTIGSIPDTRSLWDVVWENRKRVLGFAHTHPGSGIAAPSLIDLSTFTAWEQALKRPLHWWILTEDQTVCLFRLQGLEWHPLVYDGPGVHGFEYKRDHVTDLPWAAELRRLSGYRVLTIQSP